MTLLAAYLGAHYRAWLDDGAWVVLEIGQPAPAELERALPASRFTLVTAWNPQSVLRTQEANDAADAALRAELDRLGVPRLRALAGSGEGSGQVSRGHVRPEPGGVEDWSEPGWLVGGLDDAAADALARRYHQAGILHWRQGEAVRLRIHRPRPAGTAHRWVDWIY
ncbi:MAG: DUF3293 domain-containing protein [Pseudoxanthomonas sp.]|nr:DUF3293 domain-containing protein [Pseudoxanthomonas sp.]